MNVAALPAHRATQPPVLANIEAEAAYLGAVLINNSIIGKTETHLRPEHFNEPIHARIYERVLILIESGKGVVTPVTLRPYFENDETLAPLGGTAYLARLTADGQGLLAPQELAEQIHDLAARREFAATCEAAIRDALDICTPLEGIALPNLDHAAAGHEFPLLTLAELEALPAPTWLIHGVMGADSFGVLYAEPKAFKSFATIDMALRIANGMEWHGLRVRQSGVLYICGEGLSGIGRRITGWHRHHGRSVNDSPLIVLPLAVPLLNPGSTSKLKRAIDRAARKCGFDIGLIVIDTVSRAMPGADENATEVMTAFVRACDEIRQHTGGTVLGVHHSGKDKAKGLRGNSALLGAVDFVIRADRAENSLKLTVEAQKDGTEPAPFHFTMQPVEWHTGSVDEPEAMQGTLVPISSAAPISAVDSIDRDQIARAFDLLESRWADGNPLSSSPQTKKAGRYAPGIFANKIGGDASAWGNLITAWLENQCIIIDVANSTSKTKGLRVLERTV